MSQYMSHTIANLASDPAASSAMVAALWPLSHNAAKAPLACRLASHPNAPAHVLAEAAGSNLPEVRAAWLLRPERSTEELTAALAAERRADVLAAVVSSPSVTPGQLVQLAALRKRAVAWALVKRDGLPHGAVVDVLAAVDPAMRSATQTQRAVAVTFATSHPAALAEIAAELRSAQLLAVAATACAELSPEAQLRCVEACVTGAIPDATPRSMGPWELRRMAESTVSALIRRDDLDVSAAAAILSGYRTQNAPPHVRAAVEALRDGMSALASGTTLSDKVAAATTESDPDELHRLWSAVPPGIWRTRMADALWSNQATPLALLVATASESKVEDHNVTSRIAELAAAGALDDAALAQLTMIGSRFVEACSAVADPSHVRTTAVRAVLDQPTAGRFARSRWLVELGVIDADTVLLVPAQMFSELTHESQLRKLLSDTLVARLAGNPTAWSLFAEMADASPSTPIGELFATVEAALA